jgi:hypothetical protein
MHPIQEEAEESSASGCVCLRYEESSTCYCLRIRPGAAGRRAQTSAYPSHRRSRSTCICTCHSTAPRPALAYVEPPTHVGGPAADHLRVYDPAAHARDYARAARDSELRHARPRTSPAVTPSYHRHTTCRRIPLFRIPMGTTSNSGYGDGPSLASSGRPSALVPRTHGAPHVRSRAPHQPPRPRLNLPRHDGARAYRGRLHLRHHAHHAHLRPWIIIGKPLTLASLGFRSSSHRVLGVLAAPGHCRRRGVMG